VTDAYLVGLRAHDGWEAHYGGAGKGCTYPQYLTTFGGLNKRGAVLVIAFHVCLLCKFFCVLGKAVTDILAQIDGGGEGAGCLPDTVFNANEATVG
jgi:hypothetical protein